LHGAERERRRVEICSAVTQIPDLELTVIEITIDGVVNHCNNGIQPRECWQRGEKVNGVAMQLRHGVQEHVSCMLAHDLLNKIAALIGFCDLIASDQTDSEKEVHLQRLRITALLMADMVNARSCSLVFCSPSQDQVEARLPKKPSKNTEVELYGSGSASYKATQHL